MPPTPTDPLPLLTLRFWPFASPSDQPAFTQPQPTLSVRTLFSKWVSANASRLSVSSTATNNPSQAATRIFSLINAYRTPSSSLRLSLSVDTTLPCAVLTIAVSAHSLRLLGDLAKPSEALRGVLWHAVRPLPSSSSPKPQRPEQDPCGFVACGGLCQSVPQGQQRHAFRLQNVFKQSTRDARANANAAAATKASSETITPDPRQPRASNVPCARLVGLPEEMLHKIVLMLHPSDCVALSKVSGELEQFLVPVVPGLKLRLFPHQVDALSRMIRMEERKVADRPMALLHRLDVPGRSDICVAADLTDGRIVRLTHMPLLNGPRGGLLCDEPGLGKTITALSLILKSLGQVPEPPDGREVERVPRKDREGDLLIYREFVPGRYCSYADDASLPKQTRRSIMFPYSEVDRRRSSNRQVRLPDRHNPAVGVGSVPWVRNEGNEAILLSHASLIVVPPVLTQHWQDQIEMHVNPGRLRILNVQKVRDLPDSVEELATEYDVVLTSFHVISELSNSIREEAPLLMRVRFLRVIVDEGHKLSGGSVSLFAHACDRLRAERKWVMTGTPTPSTARSDIDHLYQLLRFVREEAYGLDKKAWNVGIRDPFLQYQRESLERLRPVLNSIMIRADKSILKSKCHISSVILDFTEQSARDYNWLVSLTRRNLITADWFSDKHKESLLNKNNLKEAMSVVKNLRYACCFSGTQDATFTESDVIEMLDMLYDDHFSKARVHKRDRFDDPTVEWPLVAFGDVKEKTIEEQLSLKRRVDQLSELRENDVEYLRLTKTFKKPENGKTFITRIYSGILHDIAGSFLARDAHCDRCYVRTSIPMITPCAHLLCDECTILDKTRCTARHCGENYKLAPSNKREPDKNLVPEDLIELQPAAYSRDNWKPDWENTKSAKMSYLLEKLKSLPWNEEWFPGETNPRRTPPKVIVHSTIWDHLQFVAQLLKETPEFENSYVEMFKNAREIDKELKKIKNATEFAKRSVKVFATDPEKNILLLSTRHGSVGLDLSFVQYIFLLEPVWDPAMELQIISRAHRIGSRRDIYVERLVMKGSVEHEMLSELEGEAPSNQVSISAEKVQQDLSRVRSILVNLKPVSAAPKKSVSMSAIPEKRKHCEDEVEVVEIERRVRFRVAEQVVS